MKLHPDAKSKTTGQRAVHLALGIGAAVLLAAAPQLVRADAPASVDVQPVSAVPDDAFPDGSELGTWVTFDVARLQADDVVQSTAVDFFDGSRWRANDAPGNW